MALQPTRLEFRIKLSHVDRGVEREEALIVARHPSETQAHAILRVLAWCLLVEEHLEMGPGLSTPDAADLWARDLTGRLTTWIECGAATGEKLRKLQQHHANLALHVVMDEPARVDALAAELATTKLPRAATPPVLWTIDRALVDALASRDARRQKWTVTVVGDHLYLDLDGLTLDAAATKRLG